MPSMPKPHTVLPDQVVRNTLLLPVEGNTVKGNTVLNLTQCVARQYQATHHVSWSVLSPLISNHEHGTGIFTIYLPIHWVHWVFASQRSM